MRISEPNSWGLPLSWYPNPWGQGRKRGIRGCSSRGREESQGRENILIPNLWVFVTGWRSRIPKQNASVRQGAREFSMGNVKTQQFQREMSHCPHPQSPEPPRCWQCHPRGQGKGRGREGGRTKPPSLHPQRFHGSSLYPHYWKNNPEPFSTCQGGRGAAVSGKFCGISLVLLLLLFNSQGHGI